MGDNLDRNYFKTIGVDFAMKKQEDGAIQIWDIAGEASEKTIRAYLQGSSGAFLLFDVMTPESFRKLSRWLDLLMSTLNHVHVAVVGNKIDLRSELNGMGKEDTEGFMRQLRGTVPGEVAYFETSALTGDGVEEAFNWMFSTLVREDRDV